VPGKQYIIRYVEQELGTSYRKALYVQRIVMLGYSQDGGTVRVEIVVLWRRQRSLQ